MIVSLATGDVDPEHDRRRFRITFQHVNTLDLGSIAKYCKGDTTAREKNEAVSPLMSGD